MIGIFLSKGARETPSLKCLLSHAGALTARPINAIFNDTVLISTVASSYFLKVTTTSFAVRKNVTGSRITELNYAFRPKCNVTTY